MRSYRILSILATLVFALLLTTTDAYSKMNIIVHNGGSDTIGSVTSGTDTDGLDWFTVVPGVDGNVPQQVAKVLLFEGNKEVATTHNLYKGDLIEILPPFPQDQFYSFQNVDIKYSYTGMNITYTHKNENASHTVAIYFEPAPVASFGVISPASGTSEPSVDVQFSAESINNPTAWLWNFGDNDNTTSTDPNPGFTYTTYGTFTVTLTVYNDLGQLADTIEMDYTVVQPTITYQTTAGSNGSISAAGPNGNPLTPLGGPYTVPEGTTTTFTIIPNEDYQVASVQAIDESGTVVYDYDTETSVVFDGFTDLNDYTIVASFEPIPVVSSSFKLMNSSRVYTSLQSAYDGAYLDEGFSEATIKIKTGEPLVEDLVFNYDILVTILGGYDDTDDTFENVTSYTIVDGTVTISAGTVTVSNLIIGQSQI